MTSYVWCSTALRENVKTIYVIYGVTLRENVKTIYVKCEATLRENVKTITSTTDKLYASAIQDATWICAQAYLSRTITPGCYLMFRMIPTADQNIRMPADVPYESKRVPGRHPDFRMLACGELGMRTTALTSCARACMFRIWFQVFSQLNFYQNLSIDISFTLALFWTRFGSFWSAINLEP